MKNLAKIFVLLAFISCNPQENGFREQLPNPPTEEQPNKPDTSVNKIMKITINNQSFTAKLANNTTVDELKKMLPITLDMSDYNNNEKVAYLPNRLTTNKKNYGKIYAGDIMLFGNNSFVIFYETFTTSYSYTKIGHIDDLSNLKEALGKGNVIVKLEMQ